MKTEIERFWEKVDTTPGQGPNGDCWLWTGAVNDSGYGKFAANGSQAYRAHRFAYELVHGPLEPEMCVLHECDVRRCVRPDHLFEGTRADNNKDAAVKGRTRGGQGKGSAHPKAVLNEKIVEQIWRLRHFGLSPSKISHRLRLNRSTVKNVVYDGYWSHVDAKAA